MNKNDGGPAFPCSVRRSENYMDEGGYGRVRMVTVQEGGLSLRDYFAAKAMQAAMSRFLPCSATDMAGIARDSYYMADAMLAEREKEQPQ